MPRKAREVPEPTHTDRPLFLGWFDPDKKRGADVKLRHALDRFAEKFGQEAKYCLCSVADAEALGHEREGVLVSGRTYIAPSVFYVGLNAG
jgi:hypothetical protein